MLLISTNTWVFFCFFSINLLLTASETSRKVFHALCTRSTCVTPAGPFLFTITYLCPACSWKRKCTRDMDMEGYMSTPPWSQESSAPPQHSAAGIPGPGAWHHGRIRRKRGIVPQDDCVCACLAHAMCLLSPISMLDYFSWCFLIKQISSPFL